ncbi:MAG TPA: ribose 5-phosphate isomerase B [Bacteroidales bacterium]|jgi:ribose 5-phosphate isomerase B|nr:ribose 5-phosphate isomerase B [Bacteroidales bacterium]
MKIVIASDHAGFELKEFIKERLKNQIEFIDLGTFSSESIDYPDFAHPLAEKISKNEFNFGLLMCGSGNGVAMTANKHRNVRAALCWNEEITRLARLHNDANVLVFPARFIDYNIVIPMIELFISTPFEGGRHAKRVDKINL